MPSVFQAFFLFRSRDLPNYGCDSKLLKTFAMKQTWSGSLSLEVRVSTDIMSRNFDFFFFFRCKLLTSVHFSVLSLV